MTKVKIIESDLIRAVADGDEKAFETLYSLYYQKLHKFLLKTVRGQEESTLDILQEAFLRVWLNRDRLMEIENFQAWIYKVVSTEALTQIKKELHIKTKADRLKSSLENDEQIFAPRHLEIAEIKTIVNQAVERLPHQRRTIYILSREEGLSPHEIAVRLNISINTVYNTLTVALKSIREDLSKSGYGIHLGILLILQIL
ncbi:RNA polymerase sigma factor [Pedobacter africanus]|uniref:RNA polymerase sigma factor n=1 Tax=Pedobacter africanus TaxID=151894 RepID=A0A1W1ZK38_9SPHI|nr:RNA polymerase sigma-70 factor [Pedobacter africanus]SMC48458.1 RNA polymerase sigma-70 factor, ECF subfamily [Pedobacter africanus]